jgi:hypothetical protein
VKSCSCCGNPVGSWVVAAAILGIHPGDSLGYTPADSLGDSLGDAPLGVSPGVSPGGSPMGVPPGGSPWGFLRGFRLGIPPGGSPGDPLRVSSLPQGGSGVGVWVAGAVLGGCYAHEMDGVEEWGVPREPVRSQEPLQKPLPE